MDTDRTAKASCSTLSRRRYLTAPSHQRQTLQVRENGRNPPTGKENYRYGGSLWNTFHRTWVPIRPASARWYRNTGTTTGSRITHRSARTPTWSALEHTDSSAAASRLSTTQARTFAQRQWLPAALPSFENASRSRKASLTAVNTHYMKGANNRRHSTPSQRRSYGSHRPQVANTTPLTHGAYNKGPSNHNSVTKHREPLKRRTRR